MSQNRTRVLFDAMVREEYRLHSQLFGGGRFAAFPLLITLLAAGIATLLSATGSSLESITLGMHGLAFLFGLHTGTVAFVGRDAIDNLLGEVTMVVFSARTLPVSRERLLALFIVKDIGFYALFFLAPLTLGLVPARLVSSETVALGSIIGDSTLLWTTLIGMFVLGIGLTIASIGLSSRGVPKLLIGIALGGLALVASTTNVELLAYTPYGVFLDQTLPRIAGAVAGVLGLFGLGVGTFRVTDDGDSRTVESALRPLESLVGSPVAAKTILDVRRSSGGVGKLLFSSGVLFVVTAGLIDLVETITTVQPSVELSFGAVLGLSGFTTYNWLTQADDVESYTIQPLTVGDVFRAKFRVFLGLGPLAGLVYYAIALAWQGARPLPAVVGGLLLIGVACYIFGVTVLLSGLSPNEFLFDTVLFAGFGVAMVVPLVPILIVGFVLAPVSTPLLGALAVAALLLTAIGFWLYRRALPKWERHHRE